MFCVSFVWTELNILPPSHPDCHDIKTNIWWWYSQYRCTYMCLYWKYKSISNARTLHVHCISGIFFFCTHYGRYILNFWFSNGLWPTCYDMAVQQVIIISFNLILSYLWEIMILSNQPPWISYRRTFDYLILSDIWSGSHQDGPLSYLDRAIWYLVLWTLL